MRFQDGPIHDVIVCDLTMHSDHRGWLAELFRSDQIRDELLPVMCYVSSTEPGLTRGPHGHCEQADFFCFIGPSNFRIYLWDSRKDSATYGNRMVLEAGESCPLSVIVPAGVVHAYKNVGSRPGWSINFPNRLYGGKGRKGTIDEIRHENDPDNPFRME